MALSIWYSLAEHLERHPHGALAALASDPRITFGLKLGDSSVVCHAALKRGERTSKSRSLTVPLR
jgi:hypothetical protein